MIQFFSSPQNPIFFTSPLLMNQYNVQAELDRQKGKRINKAYDPTEEAEKAANFTVLEAYGMGRNVEAEVQSKDIRFSYYSAIMDDNLCEVCEALNQTEHEYGDPTYTTPNPDCLGEINGNNCRCVNIHVRKEESEASV